MNKVEAHKEITSKMTETYIKKNHDYGDSFAYLREEFGNTAILIRLSDKLNRLKTLMTKQSQQKVFDESIEDTLLDLANYAVMELVEIQMEHDQYHASLTKCNAQGSESVRPMGVEEAEKKSSIHIRCSNCANANDPNMCIGCGDYTNWKEIKTKETVKVCINCDYSGINSPKCVSCNNHSEWKKK